MKFWQLFALFLCLVALEECNKIEVEESAPITADKKVERCGECEEL